LAGMLNKVKRGDPLTIPASTFNTFVDAARDFQQRQRSAQRTTQRDQLDTGIILIRNESGAERERFDVLGIAGPIIEPVDNADEFKQRVALKGVVPSSPHAGKFAILLEPATNQTIVRACIDGVCPARVRMNDEAHEFADIEVGQAAQLESAESGTARLLADATINYNCEKHCDIGYDPQELPNGRVVVTHRCSHGCGLVVLEPERFQLWDTAARPRPRRGRRGRGRG
jgi:hypothetical protein